MRLTYLLPAVIAILVVGLVAFLWHPALENQVERCEQTNANITPTQPCQVLWWGWWGVVGGVLGALSMLALVSVTEEEDDG